MFENDQMGTWGQPAGGPQQQFMPAHEEFRGLLRQAWPSPDAEQAVTKAFEAYSAILQEPWQSAELNQRLAEAYAQCRKCIHEAFADGSADKVIDAYRQYVRQVKSMWAELDPESIGPEDLGVIAQGMSWVASVAFEVSAARVPSAEARS